MKHEIGEVVDSYELLEELGEGGYGEAFKAKDIRDGSMVVLKFPNPLLFADPAIYQRYRREIDIARHLAHPGVQASLDFGEHRSEPYLVLEYVEGITLRQLLSGQQVPLPISVALSFGHQIAEALSYLHASGIVHRDLKPENILVTPKPSAGAQPTGDEVLKVVDFGTALAQGARRLTWRHLSETLGTPDYMSPEQIQGERGDNRSDIYSWGVMMYELLTGDVPFYGDNSLAVMAAHLQRSPEPLRKKRSEISPALEAVVLKAMRRNPLSRYQSTDELIYDLDHLNSLSLDAFDLSPEKPMGGMAASSSGRRLFFFVAIIAVSFLLLVVVAVLIARWVG